MHETEAFTDIEKRPRRFRFSLWTLFAAMTLLCMLLATPWVVLSIFALVLAGEFAAICFVVFISWPVGRVMDGLSALFERHKRQPENDLAAMARDERFGERRPLFQPPSLTS